MAQYLGKTQDNQEIFGYDFKDAEIKTVGDNEIEMIGSSEHMDRDGEILKIDGWDMKNYKKNPVVLPAHMYWEPAIARAKVRIEEKNMIFRIEFPPEGLNPLADIYKGLYKGGFMKASSVGFIGQEWKWGEKEGEPRRTFLKQELLEISLVSVPSNPNALLTEKGIEQAVRAGKLRSSEIKILEDSIKRYFNRDQQAAKFFSVPNLEDKNNEKEENPGEQKIEQQPENKGKPAKQGDPESEGNEKLLKDIREAAEKSVTEFIKNLEPALMERVLEVVRNEIKMLVIQKDHYINELLNDRVPEGTTESGKQSEQVVKSVKESFKIKI